MSADLIPDPDVVHERLREVLREAAVLRRLLRVAVRARDAKKQTEQSSPTMPPQAKVASHA